MKVLRIVLSLCLLLVAGNASAQEPSAERGAEPGFPVPLVVVTAAKNYQARGQQFTRYHLKVANWSEFPDELFEPAPYLPPCGLNKNSSRTWVDIYAENGTRLYGFCGFRSPTDLTRISFAVPEGRTPPARVYIVLNDRLRRITYKSNLVSTGTSASAMSRPSQAELRLKPAQDTSGLPVEVRNNLTGQSGSKSTTFTILAPGPLEQARVLLRDGEYKEAIKAFKRANKLEKGKSAEVHWGLAQAYKGLGAHKSASKACDKVLKYASENRLRALAHNLKGVCIVALAKKKDTKKLQKAEEEFGAALDLNQNIPIVHFNLAVALLKQERDPEGIKQLDAYLELAPQGSRAQDARRFIENPRRARENFAPEFSLVTIQGEYFDLEELHGKVVVLDFWASWCQPCVKALPTLKRFYKKYPQEQFVLISISTESDEEAVREFIAKKKMRWPQFLDHRRTLPRIFNLQSTIPIYVVIDGEGIIRRRVVGWGRNQSSTLEREIKKCLKELAQRAKQEKL